MIVHWTLSGGILHLVCLALQLGIAYPNICGNGQVMHSDYKTGERACCYNRLCQPGFYSVICRGNDPNSTSCRRCPKQTFQPKSTNSVDMKHCEAKTTCYANQVARNVKSKTKDTVCKCKRGYCNSSGSAKFRHGRVPRCIKKKCNEGFCLSLNCTCGPCPEGLKAHRGHNLKSCNSSSLFSCKEEQESTSLEKSTTSQEVHLGIAYELRSNGKSSLTTESEKTQSSRNDAFSDLNGSITPWQIVIVIPLVVVMISVVFFLAAVLIIRKRKRTSSALYSRHLPCWIRSSDDCQLEEEETKGFTKLQELNPVLQPDKQRETFEKSNIEPVAPIRNDGGKDISRDVPVIANESTLRTLPPVKSDAQSITIVQDVPSLSMNLSDKQKLNKNLCVLVRDLVLCPQLWAMLLSNGTMTDEIKNIIEGKCNTNSEKNALLIEYLKKRNCHAFETFVTSLIMTEQDHLAAMLDEELTVKLKESCPTNDLLLKHFTDLSESNLAR